MSYRTRSHELFKVAQQSLVGGVNSPVRAFKSVGGTPVFMKSGKGALVTCEDEKEYIDYVLSYGPLILGHAHPDVVESVQKVARSGMTFGAPNELEIKCAEKVKSAYPYVDKVRFVNSGTEATMSAIRLARGATGKSIIVKFKGCYHGHADPLLVAAGSGSATLGVPDSKGVLRDSVSNTAVLDYNDTQGVKDFFSVHKENVAGVIIEPVTGNMGVIIPDLKFIKTLRECCDQYESVLIFDEVMCGFRSQQTGTHEWIGVEPDIVVLGKVIGGGVPCGAYAAKKSLMKWIAPEGPVYQAGTLSGNPLAMAAGYTTLSLLEDKKHFDTVNHFTQNLVDQAQAFFKKKGCPVQIHVKGSMFTIFFSQKPIKSFDDVQACDMNMFKHVFNVCLNEGVYLPPSQYEACFTSVCHTQEMAEKTLQAFEKSFK